MRAKVWLVVPPLALASGAFAAYRTGDDLYVSLRGGGLVLARGVAEGAAGAMEAVQALEDARASELLAAARRVDRALTGDPLLDGGRLADAAAEARARRAFHLGPGLAVEASGPPGADLGADGPELVRPERIAGVEAEAAAECARRLAASGAAERVEGVRENPFGTGADLLVAVRRADGGAVVLRARAGELREMRRRFGLPALLDRVAAIPGVAGVFVEGASGGVVEARPASPRPLPGTVEVATPLADGSRLVLALSTEPADRLAASSRRAILLAAGAVSLLALAAAALLARAEGRDLERERRWAERAEREKRLTALGELGAGLAHQIRNPLNGISLAVQRLGRSGAAPDLSRALSAEVARLEGLVAAFLRYSRESKPRLAVGDAAALLPEVARRVADAAAAQGVALSVEGAASLPGALFDRDLLLEALENLARNAVEASPRGGRVLLRAVDAGERAGLEVEDDGPGIPPEVGARAFDHFVTTKPGGSGLGLPFALRLVHLHGGTLDAESAPGRTVFRVLLPREAP